MKHLREYSCEEFREGANHTLYWNPANGKIQPVPRHTEIKNTLARSICKDLDIPTP